MLPDIILASTSPRRKQLLGLLAVKFKVVDPKYEEVFHKHLSHAKLVQFLALGKAKAVAKKHPNAVIIAADCLISFQGKALGKPKDKKEAFRILKSLSGKFHNVFTGVVVVNTKTKKVFSGVEKIKVTFRKLSDRQILNYIATGEPVDRAGAYAAQDCGFNLIKKFHGNLTAYMGLPMEFVYNALQKFGAKV